MSKWQKLQIGQAIRFNPPESIPKGIIAKKVPMGSLTEFQRKINSFELSTYNGGPKFRNGDTLLAKITPCIENGKTAFVDILDDNEIAFGSSEFIVLRETDYTTPKFIYYLSISPTFRKRAISCMEGTSGRKRVSEKTLKYFELDFPPVETQKAIAKVLSDLDAKIELNNKINAELEAMAKLIYDYWFVQFDFPDENGKPYKSSGGKMVYNEELKREIPEGWNNCQLGDVVERTGTGLNPRDNFQLGKGNNYYVTIKNIKQGKIVLDEKCDRINDEALEIINKRSDLDVGDILYTSIQPVGTTYLIREKPKNWNINESVFTIRPNYDKVSSELLYHFVSGDYIKAYTHNVAAGSIHKGVRHGTLKECKFILPEKKVIERFSNTVAPMLDKQYSIEDENYKLAELRDWLLPMLMNGQVTVN